MPQLYDRQGNPVEVPPEQVQDALASGQYGVPKDQAVPVFSPDGQVGHVQGANLHDALASGYTLATDADVAKAQRAEQYGGVGGALKAGALEGASTATLGLTDVAGGLLGGEGYKQARKAYREENPIATTVGGVVGAIAPIALSGGAAAPEEAGLIGGAKLLGEGAELAGEATEATQAAGALSRAGQVARGAGRVLAAPTEAVSRAGSAVESALTRALGSSEGSSLISALAKKAVAKGAGAATEGAIYAGGQLASEEALGDPDLNGEKLLATLGHGALLGLGAGVGLTAAGALGRAVLGRVAPAVSHIAEGQAVRALEPHAAGARKIADLPGGAPALGRRLLADGMIQPGEKLEQTAARISGKTDEVGEQVGAVYDKLDASNVERVRVSDIRNRIKNEILPDLEKLPETNAAAIRKVNGFLSDVDAFAGIPREAEAGAARVPAVPGALPEASTAIDHAAMREQELSFRQMQELRTTLRKSINWKNAPFTGVEDKANEALKDVYGALSKELDAKAEQAAGKLGGTLKDELKEVNLAYRQYTTADQTAQNALRLKEGRNIAAPSTKAAGLAAGIGLLAHGATGGASALGAVGAAAANHLWKERGASTSAWVLDKIGALRGVESAQRRVDQQMDRGVARLFKSSSKDLGRPEVEVAKLPIGEREPAAEEPRRPLPGENPYRTHAGAIVRASEAPLAHAQRISEAAAPLEQHAPATSRAFQSAAIRATQYLASQLPHRLDRPTMDPHAPPRLSPTEERRYMLVAHAVHDPMSVIRDLGAGTATRAQVEALKTVYPAMYSELVERIRDRLDNLAAPLPLSQKKALGALFGADIDPTRDPAFAARMQEDFAQGPPPAPQGGAPKGGAPKRKLQGRANSLAMPGMIST